MKHIAITQVELNGAEINSVNARDLHKNFEVKTKFPDWVKRQLELFVEGKDFLKFEKPSENNTIDYIVTLETAKHIAMMQKNKKGMETRQYFIDIEEQARNKQLESLNSHIKKTQEIFHAQEEIRQNQLILHKTQEITGETITDHHRRLSNLEQNSRLEAWQEKNLLDAKNSKVYELAEKHDFPSNKLHRLVWSRFKKHFHIPRYNELKTGRYEDGLMYLNNLTIDMVV